jgi:hypothetical protein
VHNGLQATSTPRTAIHQEGEDDEDMASTHMTMLGELHGGQGDQQGHLNREGGPKLILQANQEHEQEQVKRNLKLQINMRLTKLGSHKPTTAVKLLSTE